MINAIHGIVNKQVPAETPSVPIVSSFVSGGAHDKLTLTWSASTDDVAVIGYEVRIKKTSDGAFGSWIDAGDVLFYDFTSLDAATEYQAQVRAYDAVPNYSAASSTATQTTPVLINVALASNGTTVSPNVIGAGDVDSTNNGLRHTNGAWLGAGGGWDSNNDASVVPVEVEYRFNATRTIHEIYVFTLQDAVNYASAPALTDSASLYGNRNFTIEYWNGSSWIALDTVTAFTQVGRYVAFSPVSTAKIRVRVTLSNSVGFPAARIVEVEAWGY